MAFCPCCGTRSAPDAEAFIDAFYAAAARGPSTFQLSVVCHACGRVRLYVSEPRAPRVIVAPPPEPHSPENPA